MALLLSLKTIIKIKENVTHTTKFSFSICSLDEMNKCITNLNTTKPTTHVNIPAKILVEHSDLCSEHIHKLYCDSVQTGIFPDSMKMPILHHHIKKTINARKRIIDQLAFYPHFQKSLNQSCMMIYLNLWLINYLHTCADFVKVIPCNIAS